MDSHIELPTEKCQNKKNYVANSPENFIFEYLVNGPWWIEEYKEYIRKEFCPSTIWFQPRFSSSELDQGETQIMQP